MAGQQAINEVEGNQRREEALKLRLTGASYAQVAQHLGISRPNAYRHVQDALAEIREHYHEAAHEVMQLDLARLDQWLLECVRKIKAGDMGAVDRGIKIMERRAKLLGLDAPTKIAPTDPSGENEYAGLSDDALKELAARIARPEPDTAPEE